MSRKFYSQVIRIKMGFGGTPGPHITDRVIRMSPEDRELWFLRKTHGYSVADKQIIRERLNKRLIRGVKMTLSSKINPSQPETMSLAELTALIVRCQAELPRAKEVEKAKIDDQIAELARQKHALALS